MRSVYSIVAIFIQLTRQWLQCRYSAHSSLQCPPPHCLFGQILMICAFSFLNNFQFLLPSTVEWSWVVLGIETCLCQIFNSFFSSQTGRYLRDTTISPKLIESTGEGFRHWFWIWEPSSICSVSFWGSFFHNHWVSFLCDIVKINKQTKKITLTDIDNTS